MASAAKFPMLGFVGLGKMGGPIATRLVQHGRPVTVFDIDSAAVARLVSAGAVAASSPRAVADAAEIVFTCLPSLDAVNAVVQGDDGVCHGRSVKALVDCSTTGPEFATALGAALSGRGIGMLDSPISGGVKRARDGELSWIVSGPKPLAERVAPLVEPCGRFFHVGEMPGQAQTMKLLNNLLSNIATAATYEAFVMGAKAGLDPDVMLDVINASTGVNNCTLNKMPRSVLPRTFDYGSNMEITYKDITLCMKEADRLGVTMLLGNMARQLWAYGYHHGGAKRDSSSLITYLEDWAGVKVVGKAARAAGRG